MTVPFNQHDPQWIKQEFTAEDTAVPPIAVRVVQLSQLPTSNPHVVGQVWNNGGTPAVSAG